MQPTIIHTDGASRGNPGTAAFAFTLARPNQPIYEEAGCLGTSTNNQAEYTAIVRALEHACQLGVTEPIILRSDSELIVKQMRGEYRVKNQELRSLYEQACRAAQALPGGVTFEHVRREQNRRADQLCNQALDGQANTCTPIKSKTVMKSKTVTRGTKTRPSNPLKAEVISLLSEAGALPTPEQVWHQLVALLRKHGLDVTK
jgi:ribonuclease HI